MIVLKNIFFHKSKVSKYLIRTNLHKLKTSFNPLMTFLLPPGIKGSVYHTD